MVVAYQWSLVRLRRGCLAAQKTTHTHPQHPHAHTHAYKHYMWLIPFPRHPCPQEETCGWGAANTGWCRWTPQHGLDFNVLLSDIPIQNYYSRYAATDQECDKPRTFGPTTDTCNHMLRSQLDVACSTAKSDCPHASFKPACPDPRQGRAAAGVAREFCFSPRNKGATCQWNPGVAGQSMKGPMSPDGVCRCKTNANGNSYAATETAVMMIHCNSVLCSKSRKTVVTTIRVGPAARRH